MALLLGFVLCISVVFVRPVLAGAYFLPASASPDSIAHPEGYQGAGGELTINVCIAPDSLNSQEMQIPTENAVRTWDALVPTTGNIQTSGSGVTGTDYESVVLHELGHCLGLDHVNLASDTPGVSTANQNHTRSKSGDNGSFELNVGADGIPGSRDDLRGDDVNLHWFRKSNNDPFTIAGVVDSTTYSRELSDLPAGDNFAANADRTVGAALGYPDSEAVMQQATPTQEAQRTLGHDDVATFRLAMSGLDEIQGTADDYTVKVNYVGVSDDSSCNISIKIDPGYSGFAICNADRFFVAGDRTHYRLKNTTISMNGNGNVNWYFNQVPNGADTDGDLILDNIENATCTDVADADTDDDGLNDGIEDANQNGIVDPGETNPCNADSDGDSIQDGTESGLTAGGSDTDSGIFVPDLDPTTTTSPVLADTDGDTYSDGEEDLNADGKVDPGESDPDDINSVPLGVTTVPWWPLPVQISGIFLVVWFVATFGLRRRSSSVQ